MRAPDGADTEVEHESLRQQLAAAFGSEVTLIRLGDGIFDDAPVSLISTTIIAVLETESGSGKLDVRRFRPNILIEPTDDAPVREDAWVGKTVLFGNHANTPSLRVTVKDIRCVMVNLDPETAVAEPRVLRTIARSHQNCAGVYASVINTGTFSVGDGIYLNDN
ncbi:MAG: MOSC domain-containing protein [Bacteroidota bacterium]